VRKEISFLFVAMLIREINADCNQSIISPYNFPGYPSVLRPEKHE